MKSEAARSVRIVPEALYRQALQDALHALDLGEPLPAYLANALQRYGDSNSAERTRRHLMAKLVHRYCQQGFPRSNSSRGPSAFEKAAADLGVSAKTIQRACEEFPFNDVDDGDDEKNGQTDTQN